MRAVISGLVLLMLSSVAAQSGFAREDDAGKEVAGKPEIAKDGFQTAAFGAGCYWCSEAIFERLAGVKDVRTGFMGGRIENPTMKQITSQKTGDIEVSVVRFDPKVISYKQLLHVFWQIHDPTSWDRQGGDSGPLYRSAVFYYSPEQKAELQRQMKQLAQSKVFKSKIVTVVKAASKLHYAGDDEQDYFRRNRNNLHCQTVIQPKVEAFERKFTELLNKRSRAKK